MPELAELNAETIEHMAAELIGQPISPQDARSVVALLQSLAGDMRAFRAMDAGENEPALVFNPAETDS